ncbi:MAG: flagellar protein FlgN [Methylophilaceae bacterium]|nr:flagellar protein FlgN [Methylophilaceae bacterium]
MTFEQELQAISSLVEILEREQNSLISADINQIRTLVDEKSKVLYALHAFSQSRYQWLAKLGFAASESGMADWLLSCNEEAAQAAWLTMQQLLVKAKELNRVNGLLINKHFTRNQQTLSALQGQSETSQFYGSNGQATTQVRLRSAIIG